MNLFGLKGVSEGPRNAPFKLALKKEMRVSCAPSSAEWRAVSAGDRRLLLSPTVRN